MNTNLTKEVVLEIAAFYQENTVKDTCKKFKISSRELYALFNYYQINYKKRSPKTTISKDELKTLYLEQQLSFSEIGKIFNCSYLTIKKLLLENNIPLRNREEDKTLKVARYNNTCLQKYGVINVSQVPEVKEKKVNTCIEHFGVSSYTKTEECKIKNKATWLKNLGTTNPSKASSVKKKKIEKAQQLDPNATSVFQIDSVKQKIKKTFLDRYGVDNPLKVEHIKTKVKETNINKYGYSCCLLNPKIKGKTAETMISKYGVEHYSQTKAFHNSATRRYYYKSYVFDSLPELSVWIYAQDHGWEIERLPIRLEYCFDGAVHYYFPDFKINGKLIEIKNDYLYKKMLNTNTIENAKLNCILSNNIIIWLPSQYKFAVDYCIKKYGTNYKKLFKVYQRKRGDAHV